MVTQYIGYFEELTGYSGEEIIAVVNANSKEEALGLLLKRYHNSKGCQWKIYGGEVEGGAVVVEDELMRDYWEA